MLDAPCARNDRSQAALDDVEGSAIRTDLPTDDMLLPALWEGRGTVLRGYRNGSVKSPNPKEIHI